jgi:nicotinic acid mononucleotide adenylyltransferase/nicotinamide mononucleotide (NMN) deamidase PncC
VLGKPSLECFLFGPGMVNSMPFDYLKKLNINIHIIATGAGAGIQQKLWEIPGASSYLSGASFPYSKEEQEDLLGFMPENFCSEEAAIDLASAAYMKAFRFGGKAPVGIGVTANVTSSKLHHGDHRLHACIITDNKVLSWKHTIKKGVDGQEIVQRFWDGELVDLSGSHMLSEAFEDVVYNTSNGSLPQLQTKDNSELARSRFFIRPFFAANGKRLNKFPNGKIWAIMPGAYNPPHSGHMGIANEILEGLGHKVVFEITAEPPHKDFLSVQELLKRAKLLHGYDRFFTQKLPFYIDKARAFPGLPIVLGADAMLRMLEPKWGLDIKEMFEEFWRLNTDLYITGRKINDKFISTLDIANKLTSDQLDIFDKIAFQVNGQWDISSTDIRNNVK